MIADYWGYCLGVNGTEATFEHLRAYGDGEARQVAINNWKWAHPDEPLKKVTIDCTEIDYDSADIRGFLK